IALIRDNDVVTTSGFVQSCIPEALHMGLEKRFVETGHPGNLTLIMTAGAGGQPGLFSKVGLYTYVDPRFGGAKVNDITTEDIVKYHNIQGEEWLFYIATKIDVAFIRGTSGDPSGNISMEKEALVLDNLAQAMAARNNGGIVIA